MRRLAVLFLAAVLAAVVPPAGSVVAVPRSPAQAVPGSAEPLDIGGSRNFLGTGRLLQGRGTGFEVEGVNLAVNPYCTDQVQGDRYQSAWVGGTCSGARNADYRAAGYAYAIDVPADRTSALDVLLYDARYVPTAVPGSGQDAAPDLALDRTTSEAFTFTLLAPDATPGDDTDNPIACTRTFTAATPYELTFLGSVRWNRMPCSVATVDPAGRYLLRVTNAGGGGSAASGANQFGIVAAYAADGTDAAAVLCDRRTDPTCPVVKAAGSVGMFVKAGTPTARIDLAEVSASEAGRGLRVSLFDPGEGGNTVRLLAPTGADVWSPVSFRWRADGGSSGSGSALDVTGSRFNGRVVDLTVDLTGYDPPEGNTLWKVQYDFTVGGTVTDRTTWDVSVGDLLPSDLTGTVTAATSVEGTTAWIARVGDVWPSASVEVAGTGATTGSFTFPALPPGEYQIYVAAPSGGALLARWVGGSGDRASASTFVVAGDGRPVSASVDLASAAVLSGRVSDGSAGVPGATVRVMGRGELWVPRAQVVTGADGTWTAGGLGAGSYEVQVVPAAGSVLAPRWFANAPTRSTATAVTVAAGEVRSGLDVGLSGTGAVSGRVSGPGDAPVVGARVVLFGPADTWAGSREAVTGPDGRYTVFGVDPASYQVRFVPPLASGLAAVWFEGGSSRTASTPVAVVAGQTSNGVDASLGS